MAIGITFFIISVLIIAIWVIIEIKRLRHKVFAIFLIALILFTYVSFMVVLKDQNVDLKTVSGLTTATKLYFSWMFSVFGNLKSITTHAIDMDWTSANTTEKDSDKKESGFFK